MAAAASSSAVKLLVAGDVCGKFEELFAKVEKVNKQHGPFHALLCVGQFFDESSDNNLVPYLTNEAKVPLPTYFVTSVEHPSLTSLLDQLKEGQPLCENLTYLGHHGVTNIAGLQVAYLSGKYSPITRAVDDSGPRSYYPHHIQADADSLVQLAQATADQKDYKGVDVLLSTEWGSNYHALSKTADLPKVPGDPRGIGSPVVASVVTSLAPRYHFAGSEDAHIQLPPYRNDRASVLHVTRFVSLAKVGSAQKSLYACNVTPLKTMDAATLMERPANTTSSPYTLHTKVTGVRPQSLLEGPPLKKVKAPEQLTADPLSYNPFEELDQKDAQSHSGRWNFAPPSGYTCHRCQQPGHFIRDCPMTGPRQQRAPVDHSGPPPEDYVCNRCKEPGHWIQNCPMPREQSDHKSRELPADYVCRRCNQKGHWIRECPTLSAENKHQVAAAAAQAPCWFCLASPNVDTELIVSIGDEAYLALDKGVLTPGHMLILPINHVPDSTQLTPAGAAEIAKFKDGLRTCFEAKNQVVIFYERNIKTRGASHMHIQAVPVEKAVAAQAQAIFEKRGKQMGIDFQIIDDETQSLHKLTGGQQFLLVELPSGRRMLHRVRADARGLMNFARETLATLIGHPERSDWKTCQVSKDEETAIVTEMKEMWRPYDFTGSA